MSEEREARTEKINLSSEMKKSFLDYAMSVIVARALPDVRDGLKPVHRRILYGMNELGMTPDKAFKKSARIVGDVMGKYHPHGDSAIYESMVRMSQDFSFRNPLIDGHGNFGSIDGDSAAAMRYTEARMSKMALEMLRDINKDTVDYHDNYDGSEREPNVLPARFPNLLVNGASGIAVGMATNIPPHNLREVINACRVIMENEEATVADLMEVLPGPDFPTGAMVLGKSGIRKAYETGRGSIKIRAKVRIEVQPNGKERIIVDEVPYLVNKARLVERIADLARDKRIEGITDLNDESDRDGLRVVIDVRRDVSASIVLNNLYKMTPLQTSFGFNMLAIVNGVPKTLGLKEILVEYLKHQRIVIRRRTEYDKRKAEARAHILEGLRIALDHIDEIISIIRGSDTADIAKNALIERFGLSQRQSQAILDMRMVRLTGLERDKIEGEYQDLLTLISDLTDILSNPQRVHEIIATELEEIAEKHGDDRRTELLVGESLSLEDEDLIEEEEIAVTLSHNGYMKRMAISEFKAQHRGGRGVRGMTTNTDDFVETLITCSTHDLLLFFTNTGKVYKAKGYEIPEYGRTAKGIPAINFLGINNDESIQAIISTRGETKESDHLFFTTRMGTVKRTAFSEFENIRTSGLRAIVLKEDDELINVAVTDGSNHIVVGTRQGYAVSFHEEDVRSMGRAAAGVRGVRLRDEDYVVGMDILDSDSEVLVITENGYGKRTSASEYAIRGRGGKGVKTVNITEKNGPLVGLKTVHGEEDIMMITTSGVIIRFHAKNISQTGRATQGVRLMRLEDDIFVSTLAKVEPEEDEEELELEESEQSINENEENKEE
ncbi:MAG: DNA gyrase subunit A [Alkalibacterium gilvum]|uniref:DNA gyrase subunit A n=1 Tax=Alkalibacterium gilvum TaxID=1130080 RepID=A0A1H6SHS7_9LACT|nr:DNA gyrase subunit A [Alkalibacterium gilvum]MDN6193646.1 DNA gyrase subunit A [Alkalibacterium sp.]MDN6293165.1 DNA gyrase subunit A [Alkalibacterium sp.]MDN6729664.1 DNA gyrase subunit A [Alkalibacterium sp.]SEI64427.1 DNA gyrase subunit A [Alkalibacterium gilvum]HAJ69719.1 DNA gyrase subunit A [Alkalibacterium sp.]